MSAATTTWTYSGPQLEHVAFPLGGIGAGTICLEGAGALASFSLRHQPDVFNDPTVFAAVAIEGRPGSARRLEGPVPQRKIFGGLRAGNGGNRPGLGLRRFEQANFTWQFPFADVHLSDSHLPLSAKVTGWSPFTPPDADASSLPVAALEYELTNTGPDTLQLVFSFHSMHVMQTPIDPAKEPNAAKPTLSVRRGEGRFMLEQSGTSDAPWRAGSFAAMVPQPGVAVDAGWFRGGWFDALSMVWNDVEQARVVDRPPHAEGEPAGASLYLPLTLKAGESRRIPVLLAWYVPHSKLHWLNEQTYRPWYSSRFADVDGVLEYWNRDYASLRQRTQQFRAAFHDTTLAPEAVEAASANLAILKSPTMLRQYDGRLWNWEGCADDHGCCAGSCTHVWNYAKALCHLFPSLERSLRQTEHEVCQDDHGHQQFRAPIPIIQPKHDTPSAADGQLGGIIKTYREWRISGDTTWVRKLWPALRKSIDFAIEHWDPQQTGALQEPQHNTYDIEFWGPNGMLTSFYLHALQSMVLIGQALGEPVEGYDNLLRKSVDYMHGHLFNGEYFDQKVQWQGLRAGDPTREDLMVIKIKPSPEAMQLIKKEGPKYQYGSGCLSDGVLGAWLAEFAGLPRLLDEQKLRSHLQAVYRHNFKADLSTHSNPQRAGYAIGHEAGLLLCTWPRGGRPALPFVYSDEVWTGIEYQAAAHMIRLGLVNEGLDVVRGARSRYDGAKRNPFNEYECGHWYGRALASYSLLAALGGVRYDAVEQTLYIEPVISGDFRAFLCTATGFGVAGVAKGKPFFEVRSGDVPVKQMVHRPR